jgi:lipoprotein-releasing system permease protein
VILSRYERMIARRYLMPGKGEGFIFLVAGISLLAVMLGVAALLVVMSVMNGFRAELFDKVVGLNGHAVIQAYGGRLNNWQPLLETARQTPGVVAATPLIEQPLMASNEGRVEVALLRGMRVEDLRSNGLISDNVVSGELSEVRPGTENVAIGSRLAELLGVGVGSQISLIAPEGRSTPFGTIPRIVDFTVVATFEIGLYDFDKAYVIMPMEEAQSYLMTDEAIGMIEVRTEDPERAGEIVAPIAEAAPRGAVVRDWRQMNSELFQALQIERQVMFIVLSIIVLVAAFNILSSLIMLVRAKHRDIAILRTMGASRAGIKKVFMTVGLSIGILGIIAGLILGMVALRYRQSVVDFFQWVSGKNLWDPQIRFLTELPARIDPFEVVAIVLMAVTLCFIFTYFPARTASRTDPVQVLRYE